MVKRWILILAILSLASSVFAQGEWTLTDAQHLGDLTGRPDTIFRGAAISPDGTTVVWIESRDGLCFYTIDEDTVDCVTWPEDYRAGSNTLLEWSPDSQKLVFTEDTFIQAVDSDIRMYDRAAGEFTNLTEDFYLGGWFGAENPILLDYLPTWNPVTGDLYFFRSVFELNNDRGPGLALYRLTPDSSEPELVANLGNDIPSAFPVFRRPAISEDGTLMAIGAVSQTFDQPGDGVWLVDLTTGEAEQIAHRHQFKSALPSLVAEETFIPYNLAWRGDHLIVEIQNRQSSYTGVHSLFYELDPETEELTPLVDLSDFESMVDFINGDMREGGRSGVYLLPRVGFVQDDSFVYLHTDLNLDDGTSISAMPLPMGEPEELGIIEAFRFGQPDLPSVSDDGTRAIFYGYLLTFGGNN